MKPPNLKSVEKLYFLETLKSCLESITSKDWIDFLFVGESDGLQSATKQYTIPAYPLKENLPKRLNFFTHPEKEFFNRIGGKRTASSTVRHEAQLSCAPSGYSRIALHFIQATNPSKIDPLNEFALPNNPRIMTI